MKRFPSATLSAASFLAILTASPISGQESPLTAKVSDTGYTSAFVCGRCHADIYATWSRSMHAFSLSDPVFEVAYMQALRVDPRSKELCLRCHAPVTLENKDFDLLQGITREGVTCDFCHTVTDVRIGHPEKPYLQELGRTKRSTLELANSPAHDVAYSELHSKSEFCGACHYYESENGTVVMGTYAEWKQGPYAKEGIQCQDCHMVLAEGRVVSKDVKADSGPINLHDLIHDSKQLKEALAVRITDADYSHGSLLVTVEIANVGSGHMVPTGIPNRTVTLQTEVKLPYGRVVQQEKQYRKVLAGKDGATLRYDYEAFLYAASVKSDNRIAPRETRIEQFKFDSLPDKPIEVSATAYYRYSPLLIDPHPMTITLASDRRGVGR